MKNRHGISKKEATSEDEAALRTEKTKNWNADAAMKNFFEKISTKCGDSYLSYYDGTELNEYKGVSFFAIPLNIRKPIRLME